MSPVPMNDGPIPLPPPYEKLVVRPSSDLVLAKKAVRVDGVTYVSPAMASLMAGATPDELTFLLSHITVVTVPPLERRPSRG